MEQPGLSTAAAASGFLSLVRVFPQGLRVWKSHLTAPWLPAPGRGVHTWTPVVGRSVLTQQS